MTAPAKSQFGRLVGLIAATLVLLVVIGILVVTPIRAVISVANAMMNNNQIAMSEHSRLQRVFNSILEQYDARFDQLLEEAGYSGSALTPSVIAEISRLRQLMRRDIRYALQTDPRAIGNSLVPGGSLTEAADIASDTLALAVTTLSTRIHLVSLVHVEILVPTGSDTGSYITIVLIREGTSWYFYDVKYPDDYLLGVDQYITQLEIHSNT